MSHLELVALVTTSYLLSLLVLERWRRFRRRASAISLRELSRPHVRRVLAPLGSAAAEVVQKLEAGELANARAVAWALPELTAMQRALLSAALELQAAFEAKSSLTRYQAASRGLAEARRARQLGSPAAYLEVLALLGFLSDFLTEELRLLQASRRLKEALRLRPADPLLQLATALKGAVEGRPADAVAALARALYHARDDTFVVRCILSVPLVEELSPGLADEARHGTRR